jgi:hypothetical protein
MKRTLPTLFALLLLAAPAAVQAQTYTNSYGIWNYTTTNGAITITGFTGSGSVYTGSNTVVTIPSSINGLPVTSIGNGAFTDDYGTLNSVTIPNSVTSIGQDAFLYCTSMTNVLIGNSVTNIGQDAFLACTSLKGVYFLGNVPSYGPAIFADESPTVYYLPFTTGWTNTFAGLTTAPWTPPLPPLGVATYSNQPVLFFPLPASFPTSIGSNYVLQMTTNLASGNWTTFTNGIPFISLQITNAPSPAFFRLQPL